MEVCVDSIQSARNAEQGGAKRVELCANLQEGGTTPSLGMLKVMKEEIRIPVFVMIRPRGGDFLYDDTELAIMKRDIDYFKEAGADGFVFGCLTENGDVDKEKCNDLLKVTRPLPVTFHRAIDMSRDVIASMEDVISLGFHRILTSGGQPTAQKGVRVIKQMISKADGRVVIVPGGGISEINLEEVLETGAKEFHGSARQSVQSSMTFRRTDMCMGSTPGVEYLNKITSVAVVKALVSKANEIWLGNNK